MTPHAAPTSELPREVDVLVVGAGMAGLACATRLHAAAPQLSLAVVERDTRVGGRVGTDIIDGFRCDRGFQLLNPAYPEARRVLDLNALVLQPFPTGAAVGDSTGRTSTAVLGDPLRLPAGLRRRAIRDGLMRTGGGRELTAMGRWIASCTRRDAADLITQPDSGWHQPLDQLHITGPLRHAVLEPFLAGVLAEQDGSTSRRYVELLVRSFVRGRPSVPWHGMQAIPEQLVAALPSGTVHTSVSVGAVVRGGSLTTAITDRGTIAARSIVIATDPTSFTELTQHDAPPMRALSTFWHAAPADFDDVARSGLIHLDGSRRSAIVNSVVISAVARGYSPDSRALVATTILGAPSTDPAEPTSETAVRQALSRLYRTSSERWELITTQVIHEALTAMLPPLELRRPVVLEDGLLVAGDHRDTASIQGALVSGRRAADAALDQLGLPVPPRPALDHLAGSRRPVVTHRATARS